MSGSLDQLYVGRLSAGAFTIPASTVTNASVADAAGIEAEKVVHQFSLDYAQAPGSDIAAATMDLHICQAAGEVVAIQAAVTGVIASGDRSATVDVQKSTSGGAFASILTAVITLDSANTIRVPEAGTVTGGTTTTGAILRIIVVQPAGTTGTRPQGLIVTVTLQENSQP